VATSATPASRPSVLVVVANDGVRRYLRMGLEVDGASVLEAACLADARTLAAGSASRQVQGVVIDPMLPDGDGLSLLPDVERACPGARVVVLSSPDEPVPSLATVRPGDLPALVDALALPGTALPERRAAAEIVRAEVEQLTEAWRQLCLWDPMLPADNQPPIASAMVAAVGAALARPQPLGWGPDPDVEKVAEVFAGSAGSLDVAIGQLICLREALWREVESRLPIPERDETHHRLTMVIDRAIGVVAGRTRERLEHQALVDPLTVLLNRRALERDARREVGRAARHLRQFTVVMLDVDGLKTVNDRDGHSAGDRLLRTMAAGLRDALRTGDSAYRIGGDEFVLLLPEAVEADVETIASRVCSAGAPSFSWGAATYPQDGEGLDALLARADERMMLRRRQKRPPGADR
jgi:diguanylate cyclase (GGDEF)-like protein